MAGERKGTSRSTGSRTKKSSTTRKRTSTKREVKLVTYLVDQGDHKKFKVTIPTNWKVTFGPWAPPSAKNNDRYGPSREQLAGTLRIYEGTSIRACYTPVVSFYSMDLDMKHLQTITKGDLTWVEDSEGNSEHNQKVLVEKNWIEEDDDDD